MAEFMLHILVYDDETIHFLQLFTYKKLVSGEQWAASQAAGRPPTSKQSNFTIFQMVVKCMLP